MRRRYPSWTPAFFAVLFLISVGARNLWDSVSALHFSVVKSQLYFRDAVTLIPAALFAVAAVVSIDSDSPLLNRLGRLRPATGAKTFVIAVAVTAGITAYGIARWGLLGIPHVADEAAYLWQAQLLLDGALVGEVPRLASETLIQYVGDVNGDRISAFFPGSSLPLAVGYALGSPTVVNPLLLALCVLATYWAGKRLFDERVAVFGAVIFAVSPFALMQAASFFGHVWTALLLVPAVALALRPVRRFDLVGAGFLLGMVLFSRPLSAVVAAVVIAGLWLMQERARFLKKSLVGLSGAFIPVLGFLWWNHAVTGSALLTPHRLLLPDESAIVGLHNLRNSGLNIAGLIIDFSGLPLLGLLLLVPAVRTRNPFAVTVVVLLGFQLLAYSLYYNHGISYGPRYVFELLPLLALVAGFGLSRIRLLESRAPLLFVAALIITAAGVIPGRLHVFHQRAEYLDLAPVASQLREERAAVFITGALYRYPDPMYPAFALNGPRPFERSVVYLRGKPSCPLDPVLAGRSVYLLDVGALGADGSAGQALEPFECSSR